MINEKDFCDLLIMDSLKRCVNFYGIEKTEEVINNVYSNMPKLRENFLRVYRKIYLRK